MGDIYFDHPVKMSHFSIIVVAAKMHSSYLLLQGAQLMAALSAGLQILLCGDHTSRWLLPANE